ncbi:MAG TPA: DUF3147 family protein [Candidatus Limnocylindrales bacterium]|nr:DUF3147 family protein [Candidatus Limnocylindrales bacterium]
MIQVDASALPRTGWREYALRFVLGGAITVAAGLIAQRFGPVVGGLFLAFPAIFPASATLVAKHEEKKKARAGLPAGHRGTDAAAVNSGGAALGSLGLVSFAAVNWLLLRRCPAPLALFAASAAWTIAACGAWLWWKRVPRATHPSSNLPRPSRPKNPSRSGA